jgi:hypothetical protein
MDFIVGLHVALRDPLDDIQRASNQPCRKEKESKSK